MSGSLSLIDVALRLGAAMLIGAILGINRDLRDKPAGLKTHSLVTIGSALLTMTSIAFATTVGIVDPNALSRVIQGIITGIGFLGAGVIMRGEGGNVRGLTTAATIWLTACLGIACGAGQWLVVGAGFVAVLFILLIGDYVERAIYRMWHRDGNAESEKDDT
jgi:putative Mg2+ transporter-C (MgtC) family protein